MGWGKRGAQPGLPRGSVLGGLLGLGILAPLPAAALCPTPPVVALDVGHSLASPGATSARGIGEYTFNRALAGTIDTALTAGGVATRLINGDGQIADLAARPATAAAQGASLFLSIHHDSVQPRYLESWAHDGRVLAYSDRFAGFSLFISAENPYPEDSQRLAEAIGANLLVRGFRPSSHHAEAIEGENRPVVDADLGIYRYDGLAVLRRATMPAVLMEGGVIVNRAEEERLAQPETRQRIAEAVLSAIDEYCGTP